MRKLADAYTDISSWRPPMAVGMPQLKFALLKCLHKFVELAY